VGIKAVIAVGSDLSSNEKILQIAQTFPGFLFPALGLHPWQIKAGRLEATLDAIDSETERCVAFGEVGLDFKLEADKELQIRVFRSILDRAARLNRTVIIHARAAWEEALSMVSEAGLKKAVWSHGGSDSNHRKGLFDFGNPSPRIYPAASEGNQAHAHGRITP
jgi:TatD DNase family protein